jgi:hypothetical protein
MKHPILLMLGTVALIATLTMVTGGPNDGSMQKEIEDKKINNPRITELPPIDGCNIKKVETYNREVATETFEIDGLQYNKFYIADCKGTKTVTTIQGKGNKQIATPTITKPK